MAQQYGLRVKKLLNRNRLESGQQPEEGQVLKLSGKKVDEPPATTTVVIKPQVSSNAVFHLVEKSDTLWNIAQRYHTTVEQLKTWNNLDDHIIRRGMRLKVGEGPGVN
ncbi:MAG: LysM peptidoglycan-binding domain-containing protein [Lewinella sp.]|nr:LysM peptidoglycan-binding domain-containing protein [Lewinella sp.]